MVSPTAREDIEGLVADGLQPSVGDIVRLNALGLRLERNPASADSLFNLPRIAYLGEIVLRQPTLGHEIWLDEVEQTVDMGDILTNLSVTTFACSVRDASDLPDPYSGAGVYAALELFRRKVAAYTPQQIVAAARYVVDGNDMRTGEYPVSKGKGAADPMDASFSVATGILYRGVAICQNISVGDARRMTRNQMEAVKLEALQRAGMIDAKAAKAEAQGEYFATLQSIRERLTKGKEAAGHV